MWKIALVVSLVILVYWWKSRRPSHRLPGPPPLPLIGHAHYFLSSDMSQNFKTGLGFLEKYGSLVGIRIGFKQTVAITDPEHIKTIVAHDKYCTRGPYVRMVMKSVFKNGLLAIDGDKWRKHRKVVSTAFHYNILEKFVNDFVINTNVLAERLKEMADGNTREVYMYFTQLALDVVTDTAFGHKMNCQSNNNEKIVNSALSVLEYINYMLLRPWLNFEWFFRLTLRGKVHKAVMEYLHGLISQGINERIEKYKEMIAAGEEISADKMINPTLLDSLLQNTEFNEDDVIGEISSITAAGAETISTTCCFALALLCEHQDIQKKVIEEQKCIFGNDFLRPVTAEDLPRMTYLDQVLKETLRLFPPLPFVPREIVAECDLGNGCTIPAGSLALIIVYLIHRNPEIFPNPEQFDPERFSPENCLHRHPYAYLPFGLGRRLCVGHQYATMEAMTILSTVLRRYRMETLEGGMGSLVKSIQFGLILKPKNGFKLSFIPRPCV